MVFDGPDYLCNMLIDEVNSVYAAVCCCVRFPIHKKRPYAPLIFLHFFVHLLVTYDVAQPHEKAQFRTFHQHCYKLYHVTTVKRHSSTNDDTRVVQAFFFYSARRSLTLSRSRRWMGIHFGPPFSHFGLLISGLFRSNWL